MKKALEIASKAKVQGTMIGLTPVQIQDFWQETADLITPILPEGFNAAAFLQMASIVSMSADLRSCDALSTMSAAMNAASLGLNLSPQLAEAYLIKRNVNIGTREKPVWKAFCQFSIGFNGYKALGYRSTFLAGFHAAAVLQGDDFDFEYGTHSFLTHKPNKERNGQQPLTHVYAHAHLASGVQVFEVKYKWEIEQLRMKNPMQEPSKLAGAWINYQSMAKAKVTRPLFRNYLPLTSEIQAALAADETVGMSKLSLAETFENKKAIIENINPDHEDSSTVVVPPDREILLTGISDLVSSIKTVPDLHETYKRTPAWADDSEITKLFTNRRLAIETANKTATQTSKK